MKFVEPNATLLQEQDPLKKIEKIGRLCYKSEDRITDTSCLPFVDGLAKRKHFAMLEHGSILYSIKNDFNKTHQAALQLILQTPWVRHVRLADNCYLVKLSLSHLYKWMMPNWMSSYTYILLNSDYAKMNNEDVQTALRQYVISMWTLYVEKYVKCYEQSADSPDASKINDIIEFSQNRVDTSVLKDFSADIKIMEFTDEFFTNVLTMYQKSYLLDFSVQFVCDRGVSHEFARHRCAVAQESTRYCNYTQDKFGNHMSFIKPYDYDEWSIETQTAFNTICTNAEHAYNDAIVQGLKPQMARDFLPHSLKTEMVLTMSAIDWMHFLNLRAYGTTGAPHPDAQKVASIAASQLQAEFEKFKIHFLYNKNI